MILLMMLFFAQRAYVDGIHMKKFWSCFLLSVSVILCGLILVKMLQLPDGGVCIVSLLCLMAVKKLSDKNSDYEEDMDAARYYSRQRKRIYTLIVVFYIALFALHYSRGLLIILYTEIVMLVSVLVKYWGKRKK